MLCSDIPIRTKVISQEETVMEMKFPVQKHQKILSSTLNLLLRGSYHTQTEAVYIQTIYIVFKLLNISLSLSNS